MKKNTFFQKINFVVNSIVAVLLLLAYGIPFLDPEKFPAIAILSLLFPFLLCVNIIFCVYWIIALKKQFLLSAIIIALGYNHFNSFYEFEGKEILLTEDIKLMSYNVRRFNEYNWIKSPTIKNEICKFIAKEDPDIICFQEYRKNANLNLTYKYKYISKHYYGGLAIYSKYPIIKHYDFKFKGTSNDVIYVDIKIKEKTLRVYNSHFQSFALKVNKENYGVKDKTALLDKFKSVFKKQAYQAKKIKKDVLNCNHQSIITGDFNNTAYSWIYHELLEDRKDAFVEAGNGFGRSFNALVPLRIDFILPDKNIDVHNFKNYDVKYSDHFPIMARLNLTSK